MFETIDNLYKAVHGFDLFYIIITLLSLIKCSKKGFVLSLLAASKWLLAYVVTLVMFPKAKPYVKDLIDNEYVLDIFLGISIFVIVIFILLMINKGLSNAVKYSGLGKLDSLFGFFFGFSILVFSNFIPTIYFGIFTGLAMLFAMVSVLTLLPALMLLTRPFSNNLTDV